MQLTKTNIDEICCSYKEAKEPKKQIAILAELYATSEKIIRGVLAAQGYQVDGSSPVSKPGKKRQHYSTGIKEQILAELESGEKAADLSRKYGVHVVTISKWKTAAAKGSDVDPGTVQSKALSRFMVFLTIENDNYSSRQGETHPIIRVDAPPFDTVEAASTFILQRCLDGQGAAADYRIFEEQKIIPVWEKGRK